MDVLNEQLLDFWRMLAKHEVRYIMVGGFAVNMHGYQRTTRDVDLWLEDALDNRLRLRASFKEIGYGDFDAFETMQFVPGWTSFFFGGIEVDIMTSLKGLENLTFDECYRYASIAKLPNVDIPFLHINHLILAKKATGRPRDLDDIAMLERIKALQKGRTS